MVESLRVKTPQLEFFIDLNEIVMLIIDLKGSSYDVLVIKRPSTFLRRSMHCALALATPRVGKVIVSLLRLEIG